MSAINKNSPGEGRRQKQMVRNTARNMANYVLPTGVPQLLSLLVLNAPKANWEKSDAGTILKINHSHANHLGEGPGRRETHAGGYIMKMKKVRIIIHTKKEAERSNP